ncbi:hypothetical protein BOTBODRAFT_144416 [Botryobasidium botryosum FD-172 SS1]|uniref:Uncharacterized protein n=1 Tax=Botryobasidium botryosum (strain FD-172 SS1) TaxID=930990 RepID=A0A067MXJ1_BOTB1|nr:hypothetical protein BOTBODRAFT_144416 [Botryobasidium botryosum FD-172 SS1]
MDKLKEEMVKVSSDGLKSNPDHDPYLVQLTTILARRSVLSLYNLREYFISAPQGFKRYRLWNRLYLKRFGSLSISGTAFASTMVRPLPPHNTGSFMLQRIFGDEAYVAVHVGVMAAPPSRKKPRKSSKGILLSRGSCLSKHPYKQSHTCPWRNVYDSTRQVLPICRIWKLAYSAG